MVMNKKTKLICGVGINDAGYDVYKGQRVNNKLVITYRCPYYTRWSSMIERCYSKAYQVKHPTYRDVNVCEEWLTFSNFKAWMEKQDWEGKHLDKDLLGDGKLYSPNNCAFILPKTNYLLKENKSQRGAYLLGVVKPEKSNKFRACCGDPFGKDKNFIGDYPTEMEAHLAWKAKKHRYACMLSELEVDTRVKHKLKIRYL